MLSRKYRLPRGEIEKLKSQKGRILQGNLFGLLFQKDSGESKFALIVSNKVVEKSTERNRIKRLFYQAVEKELLGINGKFLFLAKKKITTATPESLRTELLFFKKKVT